MTKRSSRMLDGPDRAPARAMLKATGLTDDDLVKPIVAIANTWTEGGPCNLHLRDLAAHVKDGVRAAGGTPIEWNTIAVSDGISMGTDGMRASLVSREVIADSIELVCVGHSVDALVVLVGCDKTIPAAAMAAARLDLPTVIVYGGPIAPGHALGKDLTIQSVFEAVGSHAAGKITAKELRVVEDAACPGAGACGGQFTANTMALAMAALGLGPISVGDVPATAPEKAAAARAAGEMVMQQLRAGHTARRYLTRAAIDNAAAAVAGTAGSTNGVLHLLAIAREAGVPYTLEDIDAVFDTLGREWGALDGLLHSIAFAPREALAGDFLDTISRQAFGIAHDISSYSLAALAKGARPLMRGRPGSIVTLTYLGAIRSVPNYNVMGLAKASLEANVRYLATCLGPEGIRANGISAGPIRTLAASGIGNFGKLQARFEATAPLHRSVTIDEVGNAAAFLFSSLSSAITGEILYVDGGYSTVAVGGDPEG